MEIRPSSNYRKPTTVLFIYTLENHLIRNFFFSFRGRKKKGGGGKKGKEASKHDRFWGGGKGVSRGTQRRGGWKGVDEVESGHDACVAASMVLV